MGIVIQQSLKNTIVIFLGFAIGALNVLFLYTHFLKTEYFGLVTFLLSTSNILMPLLIFGMQNTIIKFFTSYQKKTDRDNFLITAIVLPLLIIIPLAIFGTLFYEYIADYLSRENIIIKKYTYLIFIISILMGYFEVFYAWSKVQMKSVFGNFIREVFGRICISILLILVYFNILTNEQFIYALVFVYALRTLIMKLYAFWLYLPEFKSFKLPENMKEILTFSGYIILAGSAGTILLEIDKFMIPQMKEIVQVAYYSVGIYIASVISIPSRAMQQIINPITSRDLNNNDFEAVGHLYKKSSLNLLIIGGLLFLLINANINELYQIINKPEYSVGVYIVLMISISELFKLSLGNNGAILTNSKYYRMFFYFSIGMALSVIILNKVLINLLGINGAALATLLVVLIFGYIKIMYVNKKLKMQPYSNNTKKVLIIIAILFFSFYFININLNPLVAIVFKSVLISIFYILLMIKLNLSRELNNFLNKIIAKKS